MSRRVTERKDVVQLHVSLEERSRQILLSKNADYGSSADALANFRLAAAAAGISVPQAVLARLSDKVHRLGRAAAGQLRRRDDDVLDALNLLVLLDAALRERKTR